MLKPKQSRKKKAKVIGPCKPKRILQAVSILKQLNEKFYESSEKKPLLDDETENPIILQVTMKKIPPPTMQKFIKVHLPNSTLDDKKEVCLITGDLDKRNTKADVEPDVLHFKEFLKKKNITEINEVVTLRQLRKEYKPFEARRQLCGAYDVFLCDKRIAGVLPQTLGKCFFKKRKLPIQINMQTPNLKEQIAKALSSTVFHITCKGNSCASEVANLSMNEEDIVNNLLSAIEVLKEELPGQWNNVLGIYVKTCKSKAIPLYMSNDNPNEFDFDGKRKKKRFVTDELSTLANADVKVFRDGRIVVKKPKKNVPKVSQALEENGTTDEPILQKKRKMDEVKIEEAGQEKISSDEVVENAVVVKKSKKKVKVEETSSVDVKEENPVVVKKSKKKVKLEEISSEEVEENPVVVKKSKKKVKVEEISCDEVKEENPVVEKKPQKKGKKDSNTSADKKEGKTVIEVKDNSPIRKNQKTPKRKSKKLHNL